MVEARTDEKFQELQELLQSSPMWHDQSLRDWLSKKWLPAHKVSVHAFMCYSSSKLIVGDLIMAYGDKDLGQAWVMACCSQHQAITWTSVHLLSMLLCSINLRAISDELLVNVREYQRTTESCDANMHH